MKMPLSVRTLVAIGIDGKTSEKKPQTTVLSNFVHVAVLIIMILKVPTVYYLK